MNLISFLWSQTFPQAITPCKHNPALFYRDFLRLNTGVVLEGVAFPFLHNQTRIPQVVFCQSVRVAARPYMTLMLYPYCPLYRVSPGGFPTLGRRRQAWCGLSVRAGSRLDPGFARRTARRSPISSSRTFRGERSR